MNIYSEDREGRLCFGIALFQRCMPEALNDIDLKILSAELDSSTYNTETAKTKYSEEQKKLLGLFKYHVRYLSHSKTHKVTLLVKSKISYPEYLHLLANILIRSGVSLDLNILTDLLDKTSIYNNMVKEIKVYQLAIQDKNLQNFLPRVYGTYVDEANHDYIILEEYLENAYIMHDYQDISFWNKERITNAIQDLARFHAVYYGKFGAVSQEGWLGQILDTEKIYSLKPLWLATAQNLQSYIGKLFSNEDYEQHLSLIENIPSWWPIIDKMKKTIIYNDLQIRNIAMRKHEHKWQLCLYDWEVATIHLPQRDLVEFLSYLIPSDVTDDELKFYFEESRLTLQQASNQAIENKDWLEGCLYSLYDFQIDRLSLQLNLNKILKRMDIERVWHSSRKLINYLKNASI